MNEMLLRGCMLKNSNYVLGLVVYTGRESRIQMNAAKTPNKVGVPSDISCPWLFIIPIMLEDVTLEVAHAYRLSTICSPIRPGELLHC